MASIEDTTRSRVEGQGLPAQPGWRAYHLEVVEPVTELVWPQPDILHEFRTPQGYREDLDLDYTAIDWKGPYTLLDRTIWIEPVAPEIQLIRHPVRMNLRPLTNHISMTDEERGQFPHLPARCPHWESRIRRYDGGIEVHQVPEQGCSCGYHAYYDPKAAVERESQDGSDGLVLLAKVDGYGKVIHCKHHYGARRGLNTDGWKAQFVKVQQVVAPVCMQGHRATAIVEYQTVQTKDIWGKLVLGRQSGFHGGQVWDCGLMHIPMDHDSEEISDLKIVDLEPLLKELSLRLDFDVITPDSGEVGMVKAMTSEAERKAYEKQQEVARARAAGVTVKDYVPRYGRRYYRDFTSREPEAPKEEVVMDTTGTLTWTFRESSKEDE
jgi:hypothetical protein